MYKFSFFRFKGDAQHYKKGYIIEYFFLKVIATPKLVYFLRALKFIFKKISHEERNIDKEIKKNDFRESK